MKKLFTLLVSLMAITAAMRAEEYVVYQPTAPVSISYNAESYAGSTFDTHSNSVTFTSLSSGDVIKIHTTNVGTSAVYQLKYKVGNDWTWTDLTVNSSTDGVISYEVESDDIATLIKNRGLVISGIYYKMLDITVETTSFSNTSQTLFSGASHTLNNYVWEERIQLPSYTANLVKAKAGDVMTVSFTTCSAFPDGTADNQKVCKVEIRPDQSSEATVAKTNDLTDLNTAGTLSVTLTEDMINSFSSTGCVWGCHVVINAITISSTNLTEEKVIDNSSTVYFGNWANSYALNSSNMTGIVAGDIIKVSYSVPGAYSDGQIFLRYWDNGQWNEIDGYSSKTGLSGTGTVTFVVNSTLLGLVESSKTINILGCGATNVADATGVSGTGCTITHYTDLSMAGYRPVYIPASQNATFFGSSTCALPDGVKAYYVNGDDIESDLVKMTEIDNIPANTGVVLKGTTGIYQLYATDGIAASTTNNRLKGATTRTQITSEVTDMESSKSKTAYVLYNNSGSPEFRLINENTYLDAYKCYLETDGAKFASRLLVYFFDETSGIAQPENKSHECLALDKAYNLCGQRINVAKGLYIQNGKKYFAK